MPQPPALRILLPVPAAAAPAPSSAPLDTLVWFPTPELIAVRHRLAGPMVRLWAWLIDLAWRAALLGILAIAFLLIGVKAGAGLWLLLWFVSDWLLGALLEWRWRGQTPGKRLCGIRVAGDDGLPAGAGACFLRNFLRFADTLPTAATALAAMVALGRFQRLGDLAAGTVVVYDERAPAAPAAGKPDAALLRGAAALPADAVGRLDDRTRRDIAAYVERRARFSPQRRAELATPLALALAGHGLDPDGDPDRLLCALHLRLAQADAPDAAAGAAAAHLAQRRRAWGRLEAWAGGALPRPEPGEAGQPAPVRAAALYRAAAADLALAEGYHLPEAVLRHLHGLVARTHLRFHRRAGGGWAALRRRVWWEVPARLHGDRCVRAALATFFGTFLLAGLWAFARPEAAAGLLGADAVEALLAMYAQAPDHRTLDDGGLMAGFYIRNNVGIALACFASGVFLGLGSLVWLAANGVYLGLVFGYMGTAEAATRDHFLAFVSAHGPCELGGIALAGAAGLRMGLGLVDTGGRTRLGGLRHAAHRALPVLAVAAILVALAAPIEAFVSPSSLPLAAKRSVMAASAVLIAAYIAVQGSRARRAGFAP